MQSSHSKKFVFICGLHRSGTKILHDVLNEHPYISGFDNAAAHDNEGQYLQSVLPTSDDLGGAGFFGQAESAVNNETSPLNTAANQAKLWSEWSTHWDINKPILLEKSPTSMLNTRLLQAFFPNSTFVLIIRHPIAVTYATQLVTGNGRYNISLLDNMLAHWLFCHRQFMQDSKHLQHKHIVHYESFVQQPNKIISQLYEHLNLSPHKCETTVYKTTNDKYFSRWWSKSQSVFARYNMQALIRKYERPIGQYGYSLITPEEKINIEIDTFFNRFRDINYDL